MQIADFKKLLKRVTLSGVSKVSLKPNQHMSKTLHIPKTATHFAYVCASGSLLPSLPYPTLPYPYPCP